MNLRALANAVTQTVNPNLVVGWKKYAGYTTSGSGKTTASYAASVDLTAQVQALSRKDLQFVDSMGLSPCDRAVYANGQLSATNRTDQTGGDILVFEGKEWLVMGIVEGWTTAGWCRAVVVEQGAAA